MNVGKERWVLIDEWFPTGEIGVESVREREVGQNPPLNRLHVWFARRPLVASRAAVLSSILPLGTSRIDFLKLLGIPPDKDVVAAAEKLAKAKASGVRLEKNPFEWERAFKYTPPEPQLQLLREKLREFWGRENLVILDPMAGGGSIPYEALRLGLDVVAGELNPVAYVVLKATLEYPARFKDKLVRAVKEFCERVHNEAKKELEIYFPKDKDEEPYRYLWARTVKCPFCGLIIPLSPNWWLVREGKATDKAVKLIVSTDSDLCLFEVVANPKKHGLNPDEGTDIDKAARCPRCRATVDAEYVKREAQEGRMGHQLYAVAVKRAGNWHFRTLTQQEQEAIREAEQKLREKLPQWEEKGIVPNEEYYKGFSDRCYDFGVRKWLDMFNPRQLLTHLTYLEKFRDVKSELLSRAQSEDDKEFYKAVITYGALVFNTCIDYNCLLSLWDSTRRKIAHMMSLQAFPFKSNYAEWNQLIPGAGYDWALEKVLDALNDIIKLLPNNTGKVRVYYGDAAAIPLSDGSVDCIVVDPPYFENVMYSEVSDFFYVWLKRLIGNLYPEAFQNELTPKEEEAVANAARYKGLKNSKQLAAQHYESKIEACFREMKRVLRDDGVLTVMFTHRKAEAWASLAKALINAGFTFRASWPVATEPGQKFAKMNKGVLKYTVLLRCEERSETKKGLWEEIKEELIKEADSKVRSHSKLGITGPDLVVSVYGPVIGKFADYSIVKDASGNLKSPADALTIVAEVVNKFLTEDIQNADLQTLAYLNLLKNFPNLVVEYDLARLATVFGGNISLDQLLTKGGAGLVEKKEGKVRILLSKDRLSGGYIVPTKPDTLRTLIDVVHACLIEYERTGLTSVKKLLTDTGRDHRDSGVISALKAIAQLGYNGNGARELQNEAKTASTLLEALGYLPQTYLKKGEKIDDY
ncbi:MAG: DUF1156 domain-containing protein [Nitrososphaerota archaeon]